MEWSWDTNVKNGRKKSWRTSLFFPVHSYQMYRETIQFSLKAHVSRESGLFSGFSWSRINWGTCLQTREAWLPETTRNFPESGALVLATNKTSPKAAETCLLSSEGKCPQPDGNTGMLGRRSDPQSEGEKRPIRLQRKQLQSLKLVSGVKWGGPGCLWYNRFMLLNPGTYHRRCD